MAAPHDDDIDPHQFPDDPSYATCATWAYDYEKRAQAARHDEHPQDPRLTLEVLWARSRAAADAAAERTQLIASSQRSQASPGPRMTPEQS